MESAMTESGNGHFERLAEGLSPEQRSQFFRVLHEANITPHRDVELARLLRALQLYKAYYESIPSAVQDGVANIVRIKQEIAALSASAAQQADAVSKIAEEVLAEARNFRGQLADIHLHVEAAIEKSAQTLATRMAGLLHSRIDETVLAPLHGQLTDLITANHALDEAIEKSKRAAAGMEKHAAVARQIHLGGYALASVVIAIVLAAGSWLFIRNSYAQQMQRDRLALACDNEKNRQVLLKLAESGRTLELRQDPKRPRLHYLFMKDASGWESRQHHGVIEFRQ
jgi:hypothetical protein